MKYLKIVLLFVSFIGYTNAQEQKKWSLKENISLDGYIKYLPSVSFTGADDIFTNNLIHNRINIKAYFGDYLSTKISVRNRLVYGEIVKSTPGYGNLLSLDDGELNLSKLWVDKEAIVMHSIIDRLYLDYARGKWQVRIGRQRINWGINLAWNSNDLFNAYNIIDFDYQEKAGSDALRIQYYGDKSTTELSYRIGADLDHSVIASMVKFNKWKYDFQFIAANYYKDIAIGTGWAGNIKNAGFKGEATYFHDKKSSDDVMSISTSVDYFFKNGLYLNVSMLYASNGETTFNPSLLGFTSSTLSAKNLMPSKVSNLLQLSYTFNPRINGSVTSIYGYGMNLLFVMPSIDYSISDDWSLNLTGQIFYADISDNFENINNSIFLRLMYSY